MFLDGLCYQWKPQNLAQPNPTISLPLSAENTPPTLQPVRWDSDAETALLWSFAEKGGGLPLAQGEGARERRETLLKHEAGRRKPGGEL